MEKDHSIKTTTAKGATISHAGGGGKIPYDLQPVLNLPVANSIVATPNMSGRQLEDGTRNLRIGRPIQL